LCFSVVNHVLLDFIDNHLVGYTECLVPIIGPRLRYGVLDVPNILVKVRFVSNIILYHNILYNVISYDITLVVLYDIIIYPEQQASHKSREGQF